MAIYTQTRLLPEPSVIELDLADDQTAFYLGMQEFDKNPQAAKLWDMPRENGNYAVRVATKDQTYFIIEKKTL